MKNQEPTKPTGNLEELFRHHLAEAAVPPAPRVWEQVDNALLLAQNQSYRRRLRATRWLAAASLLLATLAGTGWWAHRDYQPNGVANNANSTVNSTGRSAAQLHEPAARPSADAPSSGLLTPTGVGARPASQAASRQATAAPELASGLSRAAGQAKHFSSSQPASRAHLAAGGPAAIFTTKPGAQLQASSGRQPAHTGSWPLVTGQVAMARGATPGSALFEAASVGVGRRGLAPEASAVQPEPATANQLALLTSAPVSLAQASGPPLPTPLPPLPVPNPETPTATRRWRLGVSYAAGLFQANVDFSRGGANAPGYNPALGDNSGALSEAAAAEYRAQQRPGLSQRLRLQASRRLRGHWSLETGLEVAQQESHSATSYIFTGEQVPDLSQPLQGGPRRATSARYRTAGLPLELRYANSVKPGFSLYGRVGAIVSALLTARTEVENNPEATRTYELLSASTPYRRVLGTARGAVGVQFRPAGHDYTLSLGPVAEGGLWSLNAHPAPGFFSQSRPYSFGLEAGVEFGRGSKASHTKQAPAL